MTTVTDIPAGALFGDDFQIVRPLRVGGMGAVYVATQRSTGTLRALKLMQRDLVADRDLRERFEQEARVGAQVESDHVVQVVGAGVDAASGIPWIAMELLKGVPLDLYLQRRGPRSPGEVRFLFEQLCHALGAAHERGIVHRDLKPANVFLSVPRVVGFSYVVKVLDFGIAKVLAESKTTKTAAIGTPFYMAPEQYEAGHVTPATDVWALGLIAFELLTGRSYWKAARDGNATPAKIMYETCLGELAPPSGRCADLGVDTRLPEGFDAWFARCVQRRPDLRFLDARVAFESLAAVLGAAQSPNEPLPMDATDDAKLPSTVGMTASSKSPASSGTEVGSIPTHPSAKVQPPTFALPTPYARPVVAGAQPLAPARARSGGWIYAVGAIALFAGGVFFFTKKSSAPPSSTTTTTRVAATASSSASADVDATHFATGSDVLVDGKLLHTKIAPSGPTETYLMLDLHGADAPPRGPTRVHLSLVIDHSGSMKGGRLASALSGAQQAIDRLRDGDTVSVVAFDQTAQVVVAPTALTPATRTTVSSALKTIGIGGDTCISCGISAALAQLGGSTPEMARRILLLSDGQATAGIKDVAGFEALARKAALGDVSITTIGLGDDYDPKSLTALARGSNGMHDYAPNDAALPPILEAEAKELTTVVATGAEVAVKLAPNVKLVSVLDRANSVDAWSGATTVHVPLGQFTRNERKTVLMKIVVDPAGASKVAVADVELTFRAAGDVTTTTLKGALSALVAKPGDTLELDPVVEDRVHRSETAAALLEADALFEQGKTKEAKTVLTKQSSALAAQNKAWKASPKLAPSAVMDDVSEQQKTVDQTNAKYEQAEKAAENTGAAPKTMAPAKEASKSANADAYKAGY